MSPRMTRSSTVFFDWARASSTNLRTSTGVFTVRRPMSRMTSPVCRPLSAAWPPGSISVINTPGAPAPASALAGGTVDSHTDRPARRREDRGIDPDHLAFDVECRPAGIADIDRRVDLNEVVIGAFADIAPARRHDARGHRAAQSERIAHRQHP